MSLSFRVNLNAEFDANRYLTSATKSPERVPHKRESPGSVKRRALLEQWRSRKMMEREINERNTNGTPSTSTRTKITRKVTTSRFDGFHLAPNSHRVDTPTFASSRKNRDKCGNKTSPYHGSCKICSRFLAENIFFPNQTSETIPSTSTVSPKFFSDSHVSNLRSEKKSDRVCRREKDADTSRFPNEKILNSSEDTSKIPQSQLKHYHLERLHNSSGSPLTYTLPNTPPTFENNKKEPSTLMRAADSILETANNMVEKRKNVTFLDDHKVGNYVHKTRKPNCNSSDNKKKMKSEPHASGEEAFYQFSSAPSAKDCSVLNHLNVSGTQAKTKLPSPKGMASSRIKKMSAMMTEKRQEISIEREKVSMNDKLTAERLETISNIDKTSKLAKKTTESVHDQKSKLTQTLTSSMNNSTSPYHFLQCSKKNDFTRTHNKGKKSSLHSLQKKSINTGLSSSKTPSPIEKANRKIKKMSEMMDAKREAISAEKDKYSPSCSFKSFAKNDVAATKEANDDTISTETSRFTNSLESKDYRGIRIASSNLYSLPISPVKDKSESSLESSRFVHDNSDGDDEIEEDETCKKIEHLADESPNDVHSRLTVQDKFQSVQHELNEGLNKLTISNSDSSSFMINSLKRLMNQEIPSEQSLKEIYNNTRHILVVLNEKLAEINFSSSATEDTNMMSLCGDLQEAIRILEIALTVLSQKCFLLYESLRINKEYGSTLQNENKILREQIASNNSIHSKPENSPNHTNPNSPMDSISHLTGNFSSLLAKSPSESLRPQDSSLNMRAREYGEYATNSNGVNTPATSCRRTNDYQNFPSVEQTPGTEFVVELCGQLNLDIGHHALLSAIMDRQWNQGKQDLYFKKKANMSF